MIVIVTSEIEIETETATTVTEIVTEIVTVTVTVTVVETAAETAVTGTLSVARSQATTREPSARGSVMHAADPVNRRGASEAAIKQQPGRCHSELTPIRNSTLLENECRIFYNTY
jgi:hypothetical protein